MKKWTRWQDWVAVAVGLYAILSPIWTNTSTKATWTMIVLGVVTALAALWSLAMPDNIVSDGAVAALGVLFFLSPWVMAFTGLTAIAWTAWIAGIVAVVVGAWAWPQSNRLHRLHSRHVATLH